MLPVLLLFAVDISGFCQAASAHKVRVSGPSEKPTQQSDKSGTISELSAMQVANAPVDRGCAVGKDDRRSDLCAQWKAADAASASAKFSWWQLVISWVGLLLGAITMLSAIAAAVYARRAAQATEETVEIARDGKLDAQRASLAAEASASAALAAAAQSREADFLANRPWVVFEDCQIRPYDDDRHRAGSHKPGGLGFNVRWKNVGKTPAVLADQRSQIAIVSPLEDVPNIKFDHDIGVRQSVLGQGVSVGSGLVSLNGDDLQKFVDGQIRVFIFSEFVYSSLLNPSMDFSSKNCLEARVVSPVSGPSDAASKIMFQVVGNFNGVN